MKAMYDAKLSEIANFAVWQVVDGNVVISFRLKDTQVREGKFLFHKRRVTSRHFSNWSVDTIVFNKVKYLVDVELIEASNYKY